MHLVLDACVALDWFLPSAAGASYSQPLAKTTASGNARFHVPVHFDVEVCGQLLKSHRRKPDTFSKKWLDTSLETLDMPPMDTHAIGVNFKLLGDLAAAYDVPYFHLARMLALPMVSRDRGIISACKAWTCTGRPASAPPARGYPVSDLVSPARQACYLRWLRRRVDTHEHHFAPNPRPA